jgi:4-carboxymuconolactone decarboxylase
MVRGGFVVGRAGGHGRTTTLRLVRVLAALGGADPQVRGHVAANLHVGNDRSALIAVLTALLPFIGYPRTLNALAAVNDAAPATETADRKGRS